MCSPAIPGGQQYAWTGCPNLVVAGLSRLMDDFERNVKKWEPFGKEQECFLSMPQDTIIS
jgi:hypothetical protein